MNPFTVHQSFNEIKSLPAAGLPLITNNSERKALHIKQRSVLWLSNGSVSFGAVGRTEPSTKKNFTKRLYRKPKVLL